MRQNPHVQIRGGLGSATTLVYPTVRQEFRDRLARCPPRAYAVVRRTRRRGGAVRGAAVRAGWGRPPRGVACACCSR